jgi:hypothetical protein
VVLPQEGETLLDVPFKLMMTLNTAQQGPLKQVVEEKQMSPTIILALHLMNERLNPNSFYKPWLSALPETFETPLFWSEEELAGLQGSTMLSVVQRRKETMQADYTALFDVLLRSIRRSSRRKDTRSRHSSGHYRRCGRARSSSTLRGS